MLKIIDLLLFYILNWSVAWILTNSVLLEEPREAISEWLYKKHTLSLIDTGKRSISQTLYLKLDYLITCIICTSIWTGLLICFMLGQDSYLRIGNNIVDYLMISISSPFFTMLFTKIVDNGEE